MTTRQYSSRSQQSTLTAAITSGATSMTVVSGTGLLGGVTIPSGRTFTLVIDPDTAIEEIVDATAVSTNNFTITRAIDGSTAQDHSAGAVVRHMAIGRDYRDANLHAEADASYNDGSGNAHSVHGIASGEGVVVGTLKTQTLTNKTLTAPTITNPSISGAGVDASIVFEGATADAYETTLTVTDPTQDNTITLPNTTGTVLLDSASQTVTNKTLGGNLNAGGYTVTNLATPVNASDAVRKDFADAQVAAAATSAASAATSASSAATSATAASTSATSAAASATAAATSASSASTSASSALTSANSAATSASSAATSYDQFDDRYLGSKTSDPTLDNDGNALLTGAIYFNSVINAMKVYTGSAWQLIAPDTSNMVDKSLWTAKGTLVSATSPSTPAAITVASTNGYVLAVNSATSTGLEWVAPTVGDITGVTAGTGLSGGGTSGDVTINLANTAVSAGSYTYTSLTVDAQGRITSASNGTTPVTSVTSADTARISIGGTATAPTVDLATSGVTAATYTFSTITVDAYGRITSASSGTVTTDSTPTVFLLMGA